MGEDWAGEVVGERTDGVGLAGGGDGLGECGGGEVVGQGAALDGVVWRRVAGFWMEHGGDE